MGRAHACEPKWNVGGRGVDGRAFQDAQLDRIHGKLHTLISPGRQTQRWVDVLGAGHCIKLDTDTIWRVISVGC